MDLSSVFKNEHIHCNIEAQSQKKIIEIAAELISHQYPNLHSQQLFDALIAREKLGSTGLGNGIAIPHCRSALDEQSTIVYLLHLTSPVDFQANDGKPVDLVICLITPEQTNQLHLDLLADICKLFESNTIADQIRALAQQEQINQIQSLLGSNNAI